MATSTFIIIAKVYPSIPLEDDYRLDNPSVRHRSPFKVSNCQRLSSGFAEVSQAAEAKKVSEGILGENQSCGFIQIITLVLLQPNDTMSPRQQCCACHQGVSTPSEKPSGIFAEHTLILQDFHLTAVTVVEDFFFLVFQHFLAVLLYT